MKTDINSIDDFIMLVYPQPSEYSPDYLFFKTWGYEQYLIMKYQHDLEQLRIIVFPEYNKFRLATMLNGKNFIDVLKGSKIVRANKILRRFLLQSVAADCPGILLWQENNKYFCIFPSRGGPFGQLMGDFSDNEIRITEDVFDTEESFLDMIDVRRVSSAFQFDGHICNLPDFGPCYVVKTWDNDLSHVRFMIEYIPAVYDQNKDKWSYPKAKKNIIKNWNADYSNVENGIVIV